SRRATSYRYHHYTHTAPLFSPHLTPRPPPSPLFPYTTLFRSAARDLHDVGLERRIALAIEADAAARAVHVGGRDRRADLVAIEADRKSTRLNSSHQIISYAVFCLKKKTNRV